MGLKDEDTKSQSIFNTKYVTWNNFGMKKTDQDLTSYQLLAAIMDQANIHEGTMFSFHQNSSYQLTEENSRDMELLQYDILYGKRYAYQGEDLYPASNLQMGVQDVTLERVEALDDGLHIYGTNFTPWSKAFVNGARVSTSFISDRELKISMNNFEEGANSLVVNQMGSSETIFRSSNEISYLKPVMEQPEPSEELPVDDTTENTPSSIDKAVNGGQQDEPSQQDDSDAPDHPADLDEEENGDLNLTE